MTISWIPISEGYDENRWENAQSHYMTTSNSFRGNLQLGPVLPGGNSCQVVSELAAQVMPKKNQLFTVRLATASTHLEKKKR